MHPIRRSQSSTQLSPNDCIQTVTDEMAGMTLDNNRSSLSRSISRQKSVSNVAKLAFTSQPTLTPSQENTTPSQRKSLFSSRRKSVSTVVKDTVTTQSITPSVTPTKTLPKRRGQYFKEISDDQVTQMNLKERFFLKQESEQALKEENPSKRKSKHATRILEVIQKLEIQERDTTLLNWVKENHEQIHLLLSVAAPTIIEPKALISLLTTEVLSIRFKDGLEQYVSFFQVWIDATCHTDWLSQTVDNCIKVLGHLQNDFHETTTLMWQGINKHQHEQKQTAKNITQANLLPVITRLRSNSNGFSYTQSIQSIAQEFFDLQCFFLSQLKPQHFFQTPAHPNIDLPLRFINCMAEFITDTILDSSITTKDEQKKIVSVATFFIDLATESLSKNDFAIAFSVKAAFDKRELGRIKHLLSSKTEKKLQTLDELFDPGSNFKNIRAMQDSMTAPYIPFPVLFSRDVVFFNENSKEVYSNTFQKQYNLDALKLRYSKIVEIFRLIPKTMPPTTIADPIWQHCPESIEIRDRVSKLFSQANQNQRKTSDSVSTSSSSSGSQLSQKK